MNFLLDEDIDVLYGILEGSITVDTLETIDLAKCALQVAGENLYNYR